MPVISIIMPTYNVASFLAITLDSICSQTFEDWECVMVDDGSTDNTVQIARSYADKDSRFRVFEQANAGPSVARNNGFAHSDSGSQYVTFMDSDDIWIPEALQLLYDEAEAHPQAAGAHGLADFIDAQGEPLQPGEFADKGRQRREIRGKRFVPLQLHEPTRFAGLCNDNVLFPPGLWLARRSAYERCGGFDPNIKGSEDWDTLINLSRYGDLRFINQIILLYRRHDNNLGASNITPLAAYQVGCKTSYSPLNTPVQRQLRRNGWRAYQLEMIQKRIDNARSELAKGQYKNVLLELARVPVHLWRFGRDKPSLRPLNAEMRRSIGR